MKLSGLALSFCLSATTLWSSDAFVLPQPSSFSGIQHPYQHRTPSPPSLLSMSESATTSKTSSTDEGGASVPPLTGDYYKCLEQIKLVMDKSLGGNPRGDAMLPLLHHFAQEYMSAVQQHASTSSSTSTTEDCKAQPTMERFLKGIELGVKYGMGEEKYTFGSSHKALRGKNPDVEDGNTYDFYQFGCDFFRPCINLQDSVVRGEDNLKQAMEKIRRGENVVFLANHQSEADPQVFSCLLETMGYELEAEQITYVAGHKVTTDPLAIPFSMGRNLICIHSKKHIDSDPETKPRKQKQNLAAMGSMLSLMKKGGAMLWVAPSGGRDRRDTKTNSVPVAPFDSKTIDLFRLMGNKSKKPTHYYPLAMVSYDLCPPPDHTESAVGEERNVRFVPVGIGCGPELSSIGGLEGRHEFCRHAQDLCEQDYAKIVEEIKKKSEG